MRICKMSKIFKPLFVIILFFSIGSIRGFAQEIPQLETISISNLEKLESIVSWKPNGQLLSPQIGITSASNAKAILVENRFQNILSVLDLDKLEFRPDFLFVSQEPINRTSISSNGQFAAVAGYTTLDVWNTITGKGELHIEVEQADTEIGDIDFSPYDGLFAETVSSYPQPSPQDGVYLYDLVTAKLIKTFAHPSAQKAAFSSDKKYLVSAGYDGSLKSWDLQTGDVTEIRLPDGKEVFQLDFVHEDLIGLGVRDRIQNKNILEFWNIKDKQQLQTDDIHLNSEYIGNGIARIPLNNYTEFQLWNVANQKDLALVKDVGIEDVFVEQNLIITSSLNNLEFRQLDTGKTLRVINEPNLLAAHFTSDGKYVVLWGFEGYIEIWGIRAK